MSLGCTPLRYTLASEWIDYTQRTGFKCVIGKSEDRDQYCCNKNVRDTNRDEELARGGRCFVDSCMILSVSQGSLLVDVSSILSHSPTAANWTEGRFRGIISPRRVPILGDLRVAGSQHQLLASRHLETGFASR